MNTFIGSAEEIWPRSATGRSLRCHPSIHVVLSVTKADLYTKCAVGAALEGTHFRSNHLQDSRLTLPMKRPSLPSAPERLAGNIEENHSENKSTRVCCERRPSARSLYLSGLRGLRLTDGIFFAQLLSIATIEYASAETRNESPGSG
jgi:hypothetical protein